QSQPDELVSVRIAKGTLIYQRKSIDTRKYLLKNKDSKPRTVIIEQPYSGDWTLIEPKEPYERTNQMYRFQATVPGNCVASQRVVLERVYGEGVALVSAGLDTVQFYIQQRVVSPAVKKALERLVALRTELDSAKRRLADVEQQIGTIDQEQKRLRENIKALPA